jgi:hypothetical protein
MFFRGDRVKGFAFIILGAAPSFSTSLLSLKYTGQPISLDCIKKNSLPCLGFVNTSLHISLVGQCSISTSPWSIQSLMKKYLTLMCLVRFELDALPFFASDCAFVILIYHISLYLVTQRLQEEFAVQDTWQYIEYPDDLPFR